jgi:hypothetical protein
LERRAKDLAGDFLAELQLHWKIIADLRDAAENTDEVDEQEFYRSIIDDREVWTQQTLKDFRAWRARLKTRYQIEVPDLPEDIH